MSNIKGNIVVRLTTAHIINFVSVTWCAKVTGLILIFAVVLFVYPFKPCFENTYSPYCSPYISQGTSEENLSKIYQDTYPR